MALVPQFLTSIRGFVLELDGDKLRDWLQVEQNASSQYYSLAQELRSGFRGDGKALASLIERSLPEEDDVPDGRGSPWPGFVAFMKEYMQYWREVNFEDMLGTYQLLSGLLTACTSALTHPTYGSVMLRTSISISVSLSRLVMVLNKRPDLTSRLRIAAGEEESKSIVESTADVLQKLFTTCLTDRTSTRWNKPEGKKVGVYIFANLTLKLLFECRKSRLATQMFTNIATSGPALHLFPASQRVTYLYYLGRFNFENNGFLRASLCLQEAYLQTPPQCQKHRRLILTYLIPANIMLGRFPTDALLTRPEASSALRPIFHPLIHALRLGNVPLFQQTLKTHEPFLFRRGLLIPLNYRLRPLLWRSFSRRTFVLTYKPPTDTKSRRAATLDLLDLLTTASFLQKQLEGWVPANPHPRPRGRDTNPLLMKAVRNSVPTDGESTLAPPPGGPRKLRPSEGLLCGNLGVDMAEVEGMVASLIGQGLLHGFIAHGAGKFAVIGAREKGSAVLAGWPAVAPAIRARLDEAGVDVGDVPAWVQGSK